MPYSRREFIRTTGKSALLAGSLYLAPASMGAHTVLGANDRLNIGLIGARGMGFFNLKNHLALENVHCIALCDVDNEILEKRAAELKKDFNQAPKLYRDYRKLLENKDVDAVIIGTPDHWHCLQMIHALQAGKHVYVEKPMANSIAELDLMVDAAAYYKRTVQVGQQQRSGSHWQAVVAYVQSGKLGNIRRVKVWANFDYGKGAEKVPNATPPANLNYDMWLGPAPQQAYNASRLHGSWRHQWDFGGGLMTDWGVHLLDIVLWAMPNKVPVSAVATGGIYAYPDRAIETPDTLSVSYDMGDYVLNWEHTAGIQRGIYDRFYGLAFFGENGTLVADRAGWELIPGQRDGRYLVEAMPKQSGQESNHLAHATNFVAAIREGSPLACTVEDGRQAALVAHMGNIALRSQSRLVWDAKNRHFGDNSAANAFLNPTYRADSQWPVG